MNHGGHTRTLDEKRYQCHGNHDQDLTKYHLKDNDYGVTLHVVDTRLDDGLFLANFYALNRFVCHRYT